MAVADKQIGTSGSLLQNLTICALTGCKNSLARRQTEPCVRVRNDEILLSEPDGVWKAEDTGLSHPSD